MNKHLTPMMPGLLIAIGAGLLLGAGQLLAADEAGSSSVLTPDVSAEDALPQPAAPEVAATAEQPVAEAPPKQPGGAITTNILDPSASRVSFQALLKDGVGTPLAGPVNLSFSIYDAAGGGLLIEGPINVNAVTLANGVADVQVPVNANSFNGAARWLGVKVDGGPEMSPRLPLTSVPYAFRVNRVASEELDNSISLGTTSASGSLTVYRTSSSTPSIELLGSSSRISTYGSDGLEQIRLHGTSWGEILLYDTVNNDLGVKLAAPNSIFGGLDTGGELTLYGPDGDLRSLLKGYSSGGSLGLYNESAARKLLLSGSSGSGGEISLFDAAGTETVELISAETASTGGQVRVFNAAGNATIEIDGDFGSTGEGWIQVRNSAGTATITLDGDVGGDGRITTQELQITGGSDLSEQFNILPAGDTTSRPGMVVCIHPQRVGELVVSSRPYDKTVAGVVSGAGGVKPGMLMGQQGTKADGHSPVALTGRVYVLCDASSGAIEPGDLLTTSAVAGHAMKAADHGRAQGAILGKAMSGLGEGRGLVLVLVSLQ